MPPSLNILFAGAGEFGLPTLRALQASHNLLHIYTQPDRPAGRGRKLTPTPIGQYALDHALPLTRTQNLNAEPLPPADLLVVIAFGQKISQAVTSHPRLGAVNLHSSRLPKFRGAAPINWTIIAGETIAGNSIIRLAEKMDAGAILAMSSLPINDLETAGELHDRLAENGAPLMLKLIEQLATNTATETPQDESLATRAIKLNRESTKIDWHEPAHNIALKIRGMYPWPGCRVRILDSANQELSRITLVRARPAPGQGNATGQINTAGHVHAGQSLLEIIEVQPEGKRPMPLAAFRNGHPWQPGHRLESIT